MKKFFKILGSLILCCVSAASVFGAIKAVKFGFILVDYPSSVGGVPSFTGLILDAADEKAGCVFQAPKTGSISEVYFRVGTITAGSTVTVKILTVSNGLPTETLWDTNTSTTVRVADNQDDDMIVAPLDAVANVRKGDFVAVSVINPTAGNIFNGTVTTFQDDNSAIDAPYSCSSVSTSGWAANSGQPMMACKYSDDSFEPIPHFWPYETANTYTFANNSTVKQRGVRFRLPVPSAIYSAWAWVDNDGDHSLVIYDSDAATIIASATLRNTIGEGGIGAVYFYTFISSVTLLADTYYYAAVKPETTTSMTMYSMTVSTMNGSPYPLMMDAFPGGQDFHMTSTTLASPSTASDWGNTLHERPFMGLIFSGFDDAAQTGGASTTNLFISED